MGEVVGTRYRVLATLDATGMSHVFEARDEETRQLVALTVVAPPGGISRPEELEREAEALRSVRHPHVARTHSLVKLEHERAYFVSELVNGVDLEHALSVLGQLAPAQVAVLLTGVGRGLDALHEVSVVHRRLTLRKLVLRRVEGDGIGITITGAGAGALVSPSADPSRATAQADLTTVTTIAPEVVEGNTSTDHRVDVYALASIAFELLAGRPVFQDDNPIGLLARKAATDAPLLREVARVPVPPAFESIVARGLARDPDLRPQTAGELVFELRRCAEVGGPSSFEFSTWLVETLGRVLGDRNDDIDTNKPD